jgi:acetylornithine deacetylase/succinyl-diaminopimelate desuccinylase-like protein
VPQKSRSWRIASLVLVVIGAIAGRVAGHQVYNFFVRPAPLQTTAKIENMLIAVAERAKPTLPKRVDAVTTLTDISYGDRQLTYVYALDMQGEGAPSDMAALRKLVAGRICGSDMKRAMDYGFTFDFRYNSRAGSPITDFVLTSTDCR